MDHNDIINFELLQYTQIQLKHNYDRASVCGDRGCVDIFLPSSLQF